MNLFAYGTLMWPGVLEAVTGRRLKGVNAILEGYIRLRVKGQHYPVVVPSPGDSVEGILYSGLTEGELRALDRRAIPPLSFLKREHPLNKMLGKLRASVLRGAASRATGARAPAP